MAKIFKPIYQCDGCGSEFDDPSQVRVFDGKLTDGEGKDVVTVFEDPTKFMLCLTCLPLGLDFENARKEERKNQEISKISSPSPGETTQNHIADFRLIIRELRDEMKENTSLIVTHINSQNKIIEHVSYEPKTMKLEEKIPNVISNNNLEHIPIEDLSSNDEKQILENLDAVINLMHPNDDETPPLEVVKEFGKYLILSQIQTEQQEDVIAKKFGYEDRKAMRKFYQNQPLTGMFISTDNYIDDLPETIVYQEIQFINKVIFGVPNIEKKTVCVSGNRAYLLKEEFDMKIENIKITNPETTDNTPSKTISDVLDHYASKPMGEDLVKTPPFEKKSGKKQFSFSKNITDADV